MGEYESTKIEKDNKLLNSFNQFNFLFPFYMKTGFKLEKLKIYTLFSCNCIKTCGSRELLSIMGSGNFSPSVHPSICRLVTQEL